MPVLYPGSLTIWPRHHASSVSCWHPPRIQCFHSSSTAHLHILQDGHRAMQKCQQSAAVREGIWMYNVLHCVLMHSPAQTDVIVSLAQLHDVDSQTSTVCVVQCHHTECPQVVIKIKPQRSALLCCNAFQVKILFSSMTIKSGLLWNVRLNDGKSVYLQLLPCWETNQNMAVTDPAEGPCQRGPQELEGFFPCCHLSPQVKEVKSLLWIFSFRFWLHFFRKQI